LSLPIDETPRQPSEASVVLGFVHLVFCLGRTVSRQSGQLAGCNAVSWSTTSRFFTITSSDRDRRIAFGQQNGVFFARSDEDLIPSCLECAARRETFAQWAIVAWVGSGELSKN